MPLKSTTLRDFSGGLNVLDDDLNLSGSYQPILDNIRRGIDATLSVRHGYALFANMRDGDTITGSATMTINVTNADRWAQISWTGHGLGSHTHITIPYNAAYGLASTLGLFDTPLGVRVVDANTIRVLMRDAAAATDSYTGSVSYVTDDHMLAGTILELAYYNDYIVAIDSAGEVARVDRNGTKTRIWDVGIAYALSGNPNGWAACTFVSSDIFKGQLIIANGLDKPLVVDTSITDECQYLVDLGSGSNANTPVAKYVRSIGRWLVFAGDPDVPNRVHISSTDTSGTFYNDPAPNDGLYLDISYATNAPSQSIRGINKFRDQLIVGFDDNLVPVQLGIFTDAVPPVHNPTVSDVVARHGTVAHKSMIFLGFDLIMVDPVGIPSIAKSLYDASIVPTRQSSQIGPMIQRNISRLSPDTLADDIFAVYSTHDFEYIVFVPNYEDDEIVMDADPFIVTDNFVGTGNVIVRYINHGFEAGDTVQFASATDFAGIDASVYINGIDHEIAGVLNEDYFMLSLNTTSSSAEEGGGTPTLTRRFTETTAYTFTYNKPLKVRTWARYRDLKFTAGCTSVYGRVFLAADGRIWRFGNKFEPINADRYNDYDYIYPGPGAGPVYSIAAGDKAYDDVSNDTYTCLVAHNVLGTGFATFYEERQNNPTYWERYLGEDINWVFETPWSDFSQRTKLKHLQYFGLDARGQGDMTIMGFVDYYYRSKLTGELQPQLQMTMVGGDTGGFGVGEQNAGSGRIATRQRLWPFSMRGKLFKFRVEGSTKKALRIVSLMFEYLVGGVSR